MVPGGGQVHAGLHWADTSENASAAWPLPLPLALQCERLNHHWTGLTAEAKECRKKLDRRMSDYDSARLKHLGHK